MQPLFASALWGPADGRGSVALGPVESPGHCICTIYGGQLSPHVVAEEILQNTPQSSAVLCSTTLCNNHLPPFLQDASFTRYLTSGKNKAAIQKRSVKRLIAAQDWAGLKIAIDETNGPTLGPRVVAPLLELAKNKDIEGMTTLCDTLLSLARYGVLLKPSVVIRVLISVSQLRDEAAVRHITETLLQITDPEEFANNRARQYFHDLSLGLVLEEVAIGARQVVLVFGASKQHVVSLCIVPVWDHISAHFNAWLLGTFDSLVRCMACHRPDTLRNWITAPYFILCPQ